MSMSPWRKTTHWRDYAAPETPRQIFWVSQKACDAPQGAQPCHAWYKKRSYAGGRCERPWQLDDEVRRRGHSQGLRAADAAEGEEEGDLETEHEELPQTRPRISR